MSSNYSFKYQGEYFGAAFFKHSVFYYDLAVIMVYSKYVLVIKAPSSMRYFIHLNANIEQILQI